MRYQGGKKVKIVSIDEWVADRGLNRVDFIKADVEGYERELIKGAMNTLKNMEPSLSLCTYHLPHDATVLRKLI